MPKTTPTAAELHVRAERARRDPRYLAAHGAALLSDYEALLAATAAELRELAQAKAKARPRKKASRGSRR